MAAASVVVGCAWGRQARRQLLCLRSRVAEAIQDLLHSTLASLDAAIDVAAPVCRRLSAREKHMSNRVAQPPAPHAPHPCVFVLKKNGEKEDEGEKKGG